MRVLQKTNVTLSFSTPPPPSVANELASQESKMWFSGGRILAIGVRNVLAACANLAICPLKCPTHIFYTKFSFPSLIFQYSSFFHCAICNNLWCCRTILFIFLYSREVMVRNLLPVTKCTCKIDLGVPIIGAPISNASVQCQCPMLFAITCWCRWNPIKYFERKPHRYLSEIMIEISNRM